MIEDIIADSKQEKTDAVKQEEDDVKDYDATMDSLSTQKAGLEDAITKNQENIATLNSERLKLQETKTADEQDKEEVARYREEITPKCDWIAANYDERTESRTKEMQSLDTTMDNLENSPVYQEAMRQKKEASLGKCKDVCLDREEHAECKACQAGTTVTGFCTGHPGTTGC